MANYLLWRESWPTNRNPPPFLRPPELTGVRYQDGIGVGSSQVYQYATGISGAHALAARVLSGDDGAVEDYLNFLRAGSSLYPLDALSQAGVNLRESQPVIEAFAKMGEMVDHIDELTAE